jgi:hypothetical protein
MCKVLNQLFKSLASIWAIPVAIVPCITLSDHEHGRHAWKLFSLQRSSCMLVDNVGECMDSWHNASCIHLADVGES